ncbi:MAG TPA: lysophospholipid acyltransferase family protein [Candidatus Polarisedimenticolaceae bacterium]
MSLPPIRRPLLWGFTLSGRRLMRRHFNAVRVLGEVRPGDPGIAPAIVVMNHPSWWDPLTALVLARGPLFGRTHYAPIEAKQLSRYRVFASLGFFGVDASAAGARAFLSTSLAICASPRATLWVTAQGRFSDPRERPVALLPGVGRLASRLSGGVVWPLAVEYPFWTERVPEALVHWGRPLAIESGRSAEGWTAAISAELAGAMDRLAAASLARDATAFTTLLAGRRARHGVAP